MQGVSAPLLTEIEVGSIPTPPAKLMTYMETKLNLERAVAAQRLALLLYYLEIISTENCRIMSQNLLKVISAD